MLLLLLLLQQKCMTGMWHKVQLHAAAHDSVLWLCGRGLAVQMTVTHTRGILCGVVVVWIVVVGVFGVSMQVPQCRCHLASQLWDLQCQPCCCCCHTNDQPCAVATLATCLVSCRS